MKHTTPISRPISRPICRPICRPDLPSTPRGFTLLELVLSIAIATVVFGTLTSLILVATKSTPSPASASTLRLRTDARLDDLATDLADATDITALTTTSLELTLPDRDGDGADDTVLYSWSGTPGTPLTRQYRCDAADAYDTASTVIAAADAVVFTPTVRTTISTVTTPPTYPPSSAGAESMVAGHSSTSGITNVIANTGNSYAQPFLASVSASASSFKVTRVSLCLKRASDAGSIVVALRPVSAGLPTSTVLTSATLTTADGSTTFSWIDVPLPSCPDLTPGTPYALTVSKHSGNNGWRIQKYDYGTSPYRMTRYRTKTGLWAAVDDTMWYRVYATASVASASRNADPASRNADPATLAASPPRRPSFGSPRTRSSPLTSPLMSPLAALLDPSVLRNALVGATVITSDSTTTTTTFTTVAGVSVRITPTLKGAAVIETYFPAHNQPDAP